MAAAVFYTAKGRQLTGTAAGTRNEQIQEDTSLCETNANCHILMLVLTLHKDRHFLQNAKNVCSCQLIKGKRGSCSFALKERPARNWAPWLLKTRGSPWIQEGGQWGGFRVPGRTTVILAQSSSALVLPFSAFTTWLRAGWTDVSFL